MKIGLASVLAFGEGFGVPIDEYLLSEDETVSHLAHSSPVWELVANDLYKVRLTLDSALRGYEYE